MQPPRKPYTETTIKALTIKETTISLVGTVISTTAQDFLLDDGTGTIQCISDQPPTSDYIRVFGTLRPTAGEGYTLEVAFTQDFSHIDKKLYQKIRERLA
ncbi:MAG TPA: OB-fold nucleic acid binding domain-containing protein [Candidatus Nanoarchaeia archaeon]|nr:OB-fold nucleic acid binding domain-containing protein [Candidatus Nanoarchaeia archaeon]